MDHTLSLKEAIALLEEHQGAKPDRVAHSLAVTKLAAAIGRELNRQGLNLDMELIKLSAVLHDIRKGHPDHDRSGGELLRALGHPAIAAVVEVHTRLGGVTPGPLDPVTEAEVVYIADKSYRRTTRVSIEERYGIWRKTWQDNPERLESLARGEDRAKTVRRRLELAMGKPLDSVLPDQAP
uniref:HD domain-containing protein n=1 Tax=Fundidesulfovibrio putealis TaxID=270496 RepID=A0A7C4EJ00_9BACT